MNPTLLILLGIEFHILPTLANIFLNAICWVPNGLVPAKHVDILSKTVRVVASPAHLGVVVKVVWKGHDFA